MNFIPGRIPPHAVNVLWQPEIASSIHLSIYSLEVPCANRRLLFLLLHHAIFKRICQVFLLIFFKRRNSTLVVIYFFFFHNCLKIFIVEKYTIMLSIVCVLHTDITASGACCATFRFQTRFLVFCVAPLQLTDKFETSTLIFLVGMQN